MKRLSLIWAAALALCGSLQGQTEKSLFWQVSHPEQPGRVHYLFGTIHLQDSSLNCFSDEVWTALHSCDIVAGELDLTDPAGIMKMMSASVMKDTTLSQLYTPDEYEKLSSVMKSLVGESQWSFYQRMKPFFLMGAVFTGLDTVPRFLYPMDMRFQMAASKATGLETYEEQLGAVNSMSLKEQADMLLEMALNPDSLKTQLNILRQVYRSQDVDRMQEVMVEMEMTDEMMDSFIHRRNEVMTDRFIQLMDAAEVFCAVGAGHLGGESGLVRSLREKGFELTPLTFTFLESGCQ